MTAPTAGAGAGIECEEDEHDACVAGGGRWEGWREGEMGWWHAAELWTVGEQSQAGIYTGACPKRVCLAYALTRDTLLIAIKQTNADA